MELLQNVTGTLRVPGPGDDPVIFEDPPKVTVTRDSTGEAVVTGAVATKVEDGDDVYFALELSGAQLNHVDLLRAVWTDEDSSYTTYAEVVGGYVVSLAKIERKLDEAADKADLVEKREQATRDIESACGVAFRPRYGREILNGSGSRQLMLKQPKLLRVLAVVIDGEDLTEEELDALTVDPAGFLGRDTRWPEGQANVSVAYVHGYESFGPAELPVRDLAAYMLTPSPTDWNERATSHVTELGTYSLVVPGVRGAVFPLPSVNAFVEANSYPSVG